MLIFAEFLAGSPNEIETFIKLSAFAEICYLWVSLINEDVAGLSPNLLIYYKLDF